MYKMDFNYIYVYFFKHNLFFYMYQNKTHICTYLQLLKLSNIQITLTPFEHTTTLYDYNETDSFTVLTI